MSLRYLPVIAFVGVLMMAKYAASISFSPEPTATAIAGRILNYVRIDLHPRSAVAVGSGLNELLSSIRCHALFRYAFGILARSWRTAVILDLILTLHGV